MSTIEYVIIVLIGLVLAILVGGEAADGARRSRLMEQCLADGNKEYECVGIINGNRRAR